MLHNAHSLKYNQAIVAVGGNLTGQKDSPVGCVIAAIAALSDRAGTILARSKLYQTPSFPADSGPDFVNAIVAIETDHSPDALLEILHDIEAEFGRTRHQRWAPRTLDLDLIAFGDVIRPDAKVLRYWISMPVAQQMKDIPEELILPHPRLQDRGFVLVPMADVVPQWRHPILGTSVREMYAALDPSDIDQITVLTDEM